MKIVSASEMREIDRVTSERFGVPSLTLMENAGASVAEFVQSSFSSKGVYGIICGKGNNGGDGFVVARKLHEIGRKIQVLLLIDPSELRGDAATNFEKLPIQPVIAKTAQELNSDATRAVFESQVLIDAILGTGFRPPAAGHYAQAIERINAS